MATDTRVQVEQFCWRFPEVAKESVVNVSSIFEQVIRTNKEKGSQDLDEQGVARVFELLGDPRSIPELRQLFAVYSLDGVKPKRLNFAQICCFVFGKAFDDFNKISEAELRDIASKDAAKRSKEAEVGATPFAVFVFGHYLRNV